MAFTEDLDPFFSDFGTDATIGAATVDVIFDRAFLASMAGDIGSTQPVAAMRTSDVTARSVASGTAITIASTGYTVRELQPDGTGMTLLVLEKS